MEFVCSWCWEIFLFLRLPANAHLQYYTSTLKVMYSHEKSSSRRGRSQAMVFRPYPLHKVRTESPVTGSLVLFVSRDAGTLVSRRLPFVSDSSCRRSRPLGDDTQTDICSNLVLTDC